MATYILKGVFSRARFNMTRLFKKGNEVYPAYTNAGAPTSGGSGTLKDVAEPGSLLIDTTNKTLYQNTNTAASPTWTVVTAAGGFRSQPVAAALTATGTTRADALALTAQINQIGTAAASTGVVLPTPVIGAPITIFNDGASAIKVYAPASWTIDGVAGSTGVALTNAKRAVFYPVAANTIISAQMGVVSA